MNNFASGQLERGGFKAYIISEIITKRTTLRTLTHLYLLLSVLNMHTEQTITPNQQFYLCVELLDMTLRKCSWSALVKMSKVSKFLREMVFSMIRTRVRKMVSKYIPSQDIDRFFEIMAETKSVIAGSLVRCIMTVDDRGMFDRHYPLQLNIVVPFLQKVDPSDGGTDGYQQWKRFLLGRKYDNECGGGDGIAPFHLSATASMWTLHKCVRNIAITYSIIAF